MEKNQPSGTTDKFQAMLRQLRATFIDGMPARLEKLDSLLLAMEKQHAIGEEDFHEICRIVHTIKGTGGAYGLHILTTICHQFEDLLQSVAGNLSDLPQQFIDHSFAYNDLLKAVIDQARNGSEIFPEIERAMLGIHEQYADAKYSVLLVENSKLNTQIYQQALKDLRVRVEVVPNGYDALFRALNEPFSILITSGEAPVLNGVALIAAVRLSSLKSRKIRTILLTSSSDQVNKTHREVDADYVILKDKSCAEKLLAVVSKIITELDEKSKTA